MNKQKGMTLVELMAVVAISGALAAIAIPKLNSLTVKAKNTELKIQISTFYRVMPLTMLFMEKTPLHFNLLDLFYPSLIFSIMQQ